MATRANEASLTTIARCDASLADAIERALAPAWRTARRLQSGDVVTHFGLHLDDLYCRPIARTAWREQLYAISLIAGQPHIYAPEERRLRRREPSDVVDAHAPHFRAVERVLGRRSRLAERDGLDDAPAVTRMAGVVNACLEAFTRLEAKGTFGSEPGRDALLLDPGLEWLDDAAWLDAIGRINSPRLVAEVALDVARDADLRRIRRGVPLRGSAGTAQQRDACLDLLAHSDWFRRWIGAWHLGLIGGGSDDLLSVLRATLADPDSRVRIAAARSIALLGEALGADAVRIFTEGIADRDVETRESAAWALAAITRTCRHESADLVPALTDPDPSVRTAAAVGLMRAAPEPSSALIRQIEAAATPIDGSPAAELAAAYAIGVGASTEPEPGPFQRRLLTAAGRTEGTLTSEAGWMLGEIAPLRSSALASLLSVLTLQPGACAALKQVGAVVVPALVDGLDSEDPKRVEAAADALAELGTEAIAAVPALVRTLRSPHWGARFGAVNALGSMRWRARDAIPALTELTSDEHPAVCSAARKALYWIQRPPPPPE